MNSPTRIIHDMYDGLLRVARVPLRSTETAPAAHLAEELIVQQPGSCTLPNSLEAAFVGRALPAFEYSWDAAKLTDLRNVYLVGDQAQIFFPDGTFYVPCIYPHQKRLEIMRIRRPIYRAAQHIEGTLFHLNGRNHENKGHFLLQHLPRILAARSYLEKLKDYRILVAPGHARWQKNFLRLMGFDESRVIEGTQGTLHADRVIYVPLTYGTNALCPPEDYAQIRRAAAAVEQKAPPAQGKPLFITRRDAPDKRLLNEDEIIAATQAVVGEVEIFDFAGKTLEDQIRIFRRAPLIMGAIGQGLCNALFAEGKVLVTLAPGSEDAEVYASGHGTQLALLGGNQAVTFYNGTAGESRGNWSFPQERFAEMLDRLVRLPGLQHLDQRGRTKGTL